MADTSRKSLVKAVFKIPEWYVMSEKEEKKIYKYICETSNHDEARLFRLMDCSTCCDESFCFFCAIDEGLISPSCRACTTLYSRE